MNAYKTYITIENPKQVVLSDLPFQIGQRVEIIVLAEDNPQDTISNKVRNLFDKTQAIPGVEEVTDEDIAAEIEAYRRGE
jgi:hypothetical protein